LFIAMRAFYGLSLWITPHLLFTYPDLHHRLLRELVPSFTDLKTSDALWDPADPMPAIVEPLRAVKNLAVSDSKAILRMLRPAPLRSEEGGKAKLALANVQEARRTDDKDPR
jgi:hypothetical protein